MKQTVNHGLEYTSLATLRDEILFDDIPPRYTVSVPVLAYVSRNQYITISRFRYISCDRNQVLTVVTICSDILVPFQHRGKFCDSALAV